MAFRVEPSAKAKYELDAILEWLIAQEAGETGLRWFLKMKEAVDSLSELPQRCPLDVVVILHIRHGCRRRLRETQ